MKVALHICCGICAAGAAERLVLAGHQVFGFFFNPNIHPPEEYQRRLESARKVALELGFSLAEGPYNPEEWHRAMRGLENEPEGGKRCADCFRFRLAGTSRFMQSGGYDAFATTISMGSNKPAEVINREGEMIGGGKFLQFDFKKKEGFKRANQLAKNWGLYRQSYCGCTYSFRPVKAPESGL
jgi:epoxyqueuosine reductase